MYKIKRFGLLGNLFGGKSNVKSTFTPDISDIEEIDSYRAVIKAFPKLKSPQLDKIIRNQSAIVKLNELLDRYQVLKDFSGFELIISNNQFNYWDIFDEKTYDLRMDLKSNDYIALDLEYGLAFEISTSKFIIVDSPDVYGKKPKQIMATYSNIGGYVEMVLKDIKLAIDNVIEFEMPENEDEIRSMYDKYVKLVK